MPKDKCKKIEDILLSSMEIKPLLTAQSIKNKEDYMNEVVEYYPDYDRVRCLPPQIMTRKELYKKFNRQLGQSIRRHHEFLIEYNKAKNKTSRSHSKMLFGENYFSGYYN